MTSRSIQGVLMVLAAALLWGTTGTAQSLAPPQLSPYWVGTLRLLVAALFFAPWLLRAQPPGAPALRALPWPGIAAAALCMTVYNLAFFAGVRATGVAVGTALALGSGPVWAGLLQGLGSGRWPAGGWWAGTTLAVAGGALMIAGPSQASSAQPATALGVGLCLLAGLSYAAYTGFNKRLVATAPAGSSTGAIFTLAALLALPLAGLLAGLPSLGWADLAVVGWLGVMSTGVAYLLYSHALRQLSGATAVALALAEPVVAFLLAVAIVGETPGTWAWTGLLAVLAGLAGVIRAEWRSAGAPVSAQPAGRRPGAG